MMGRHHEIAFNVIFGNSYGCETMQSVGNMSFICTNKSYAIDVAFMDKRESCFSGENLGWRLETIIYS